MATRVTVQEPRRFYDGGLPPRDGRPAVPPDPDRDPRIVLERHTDAGLESFALERRIGYADRHLGEILVPADTGFRTDLTSTPALFTWLVPKTGAHLSAALIHDGLVGGEDEPSYVSTRGHVIDRVQADRVFRDAMTDTGTGVLRRWIVWSAVTLATVFVPGGLPWPPVSRWAHRAGAATAILLIGYLGYCATSDLVDRHWVLARQVPWMGARPWWQEVVGGLAGAIVVPLALSVLWGRFRAAGAIVGVLLAVLLHVSVALAAISLGYQLLERFARAAPALARVAAVTVCAAALVVFVLFSVR